MFWTSFLNNATKMSWRRLHFCGEILWVGKKEKATSINIKLKGCLRTMQIQKNRKMRFTISMDKYATQSRTVAVANC